VGQVIRVDFRRSAKTAHATRGTQRERGKWVGINIYIDPESDLKAAQLHRYLLHAILNVYFGRSATKGLYTDLFVEGGVLQVRCKSTLIQPVREVISAHLPGLCHRRVKRSA